MAFFRSNFFFMGTYKTVPSTLRITENPTPSLASLTVKSDDIFSLLCFDFSLNS